MTPQLDLSSFPEWRDTPPSGVSTDLPLVIDVREPWELQTASVKPDGFTLMHIPMREIPQRIAGLRNTYGTAHPIACLCHHGMRSMQVANYLTQGGFTHVVNLQGGIDAWSKQVDAGVPLY
jgi:rhodanese-related sulfurtransferase